MLAVEGLVVVEGEVCPRTSTRQSTRSRKWAAKTRPLSGSQFKPSGVCGRAADSEADLCLLYVHAFRPPVNLRSTLKQTTRTQTRAQPL